MPAFGITINDHMINVGRFVYQHLQLVDGLEAGIDPSKRIHRWLG